MIIYISETDKGKFSVYGDRLVCEPELITVMFFDKSFSPNSMNYRILTAYEELGTVAEFKQLKQENARLGNLCDKLNKDYFEQKNIAADALKELTTQIRDQKLYETRTCNLDKNYLCSSCGASQADIRKKYSNFCSNCGAKIIE